MSVLQSSSGIAAEIAQSELATVATLVATVGVVAVVAFMTFIALAPHLSHPRTEGFGATHAETDVLETDADAGALSAADD